mmetsp:Transcript_20779/g.44952  ORF Transcript_20779/g.44952 Transcript_20779/m.44952 type:complete len:105 (-) Transcript_20779:592-906(-)
MIKSTAQEQTCSVTSTLESTRYRYQRTLSVSCIISGSQRRPLGSCVKQKLLRVLANQLVYGSNSVKVLKDDRILNLLILTNNIQCNKYQHTSPHLLDHLDHNQQ